MTLPLPAAPPSRPGPQTVPYFPKTPCQLSPGTETSSFTRHTTQSPKSEDLADDQRYLLGLLHIAWAQLLGGEPDSC